MDETDLNRRHQESLKTKILDLSGLRLTFSLPSFVAELKYLKCISLYKNLLETIPEGIFRFDLLEELNLYRNKIKQIPSRISELSNLKILNLGSNHLEELPQELYDLRKIEELDLSNNEITSVSSQIVNLEHLRDLKLYRNHLQKVPGELGKLTQLKKLDLSQNQIVNLPSQIGHLKLQFFSMSCVPIYAKLFTFFLDVGENPLRSPPIEVVIKGRQAILEFLKMQVTDPSSCYAEGPGLESTLIGLPSTFFLYAVMKDGTQRNAGGDIFDIKVAKSKDISGNSLEPLRLNDTDVIISFNIVDNSDGSYTVHYTSEESGSFVISIHLDGQPIKGNPFYLNIEPDIRNEYKVIQNKHSLSLKRIEELESEVAALKASLETEQQANKLLELEVERLKSEKDEATKEVSLNKEKTTEHEPDDALISKKDIEEAKHSKKSAINEFEDEPNVKSQIYDSQKEELRESSPKKEHRKKNEENLGDSTGSSAKRDKRKSRHLENESPVRKRGDVRMTRSHSTPNNHMLRDPDISPEDHGASIDTNSLSFKDKLTFWFSKAFTGKESKKHNKKKSKEEKEEKKRKKKTEVEKKDEKRRKKEDKKKKREPNLLTKSNDSDLESEEVLMSESGKDDASSVGADS